MSAITSVGVVGNRENIRAANLGRLDGIGIAVDDQSRCAIWQG